MARASGLILAVIWGEAAGQQLTFERAWSRADAGSISAGAVLAGPRVDDAGAPGLGSKMTDADLQRRRSLDHATVARVVRRIASDETPDDTRMPVALRDALLARLDTHERAMVVYDERYSEELARHRKTLRDGGFESELAAEDRPSVESMMAARRRLDRINESRPEPAEAWQMVWDELAEKQRARGLELLDEEILNAQRIREAEMARVQLASLEEARRRDRIRLADEAAPGFRVEDLPERVRERLERMPEDRREAMLARLKLAHAARAAREAHTEETRGQTDDAPEPGADDDAMPEMGMPGRLNQPAAPRSGPKPPPSMDSVPLPAPRIEPDGGTDGSTGSDNP